MSAAGKVTCRWNGEVLWTAPHGARGARTSRTPRRGATSLSAVGGPLELTRAPGNTRVTGKLPS